LLHFERSYFAGVIQEFDFGFYLVCSSSKYFSCCYLCGIYFHLEAMEGAFMAIIPLTMTARMPQMIVKESMAVLSLEQNNIQIKVSN
jgi:hypothetical protein